MKIVKINKKRKLIIGVLLIVVLFLGIYFYIDNSIVKISPSFEKKLKTLIIQENQNTSHPADFIAESHKIFCIKETKDETIVYGRFCIMKYEKLKLSENYNDLMVIYLNKDKNEIIDIWTPKDGTEYTSSILKQFPLVTWSRALTRTNRYDESLIEDCHEQLLEYNSMSNEN
ncbi:MAG: hypothetical protein ACLUVC_14575 [Longibaculum sp.]